MLEKSPAGRADALNAGADAARFPLVCHVGADTILEPSAVLRLAALFLDPSVIAASGPVLPLQGAEAAGAARWQQIAPIWQDIVLPAGMASLGACIPGGVAMVSRQVLIACDGWSAASRAEDLDLLIRLQRGVREGRVSGSIVFSPDPLGALCVPSDMWALRARTRQRQRGLWRVLVTHAALMFRPKYGALGLVVLPWLALVQLAGPAVEALA